MAKAIPFILRINKIIKLFKRVLQSENACAIIRVRLYKREVIKIIMNKHYANNNTKHKFRNENRYDELTRSQLDNYKKRGLSSRNSSSMNKKNDSKEDSSVFVPVEEEQAFNTIFADQLISYLKNKNVENEKEQA